MAEIEAAKPHTPNGVEVGREKEFNRPSDEHDEFDEKNDIGGFQEEETPKLDDKYDPNVCVAHYM
jgi:hypothetical protein